MSAVTEDAPLAGERIAGVRRRSVRKRFAVVSVAALAVLGAALGISFTADTGVTALSSIQSGTASFVYPANYAALTSGSPFPSALSTTTWMHNAGGSGATAYAASPAWTPVANQAGSVTQAGDIAFIDATTSQTSSPNLLVTIYITNMSALSLDYGSFAWPIRIYSGTASGGSVTWGSAAANSDTTYLTNTQGYETFKVPTGTAQYYVITMDQGGSYFTTSTATTGTPTTPSLTPQFYITATPSS